MAQYWQAYVMHQTYMKINSKEGKEFVVAIAKAMSFDPNDFGRGAKLMEHGFLGDVMTETVVGLLCDASRNPPDMGIPTEFKGFRIAWVGAGMDENDLLDHGMTLNKWKTFSNKDVAIPVGPSSFDPAFYKDGFDPHGNPRFEPILVCDERKEYLDIIAYHRKAIALRTQYGRMKGREEEFIPHPLPLLCAVGNRQHLGDYLGTNMAEVGTWAFKHIRAVYYKKNIPEGYRDISGNVFEERTNC